MRPKCNEGVRGKYIWEVPGLANDLLDARNRKINKAVQGKSAMAPRKKKRKKVKV